MSTNSNQVIIDRFNSFIAKAVWIFDVNRLKETPREIKKERFEDAFNPFYDNLESEIKSLPSSPFINVEIDKWLDKLDYEIKKVGQKSSMRNPYRKKLVVKLLEIKSALPIEKISKGDFQNTNFKPINENEVKTSNNIQAKPGLDGVVYPDYILQFSKIEQELIKREYLNDQYQWLQNKTTFCEFLVVIMRFKYTLSRVSDLKVRHFFEKRYGKEEGYLSELFKPIKRPKIKTAEITFAFISSPEKTS